MTKCGFSVLCFVLHCCREVGLEPTGDTYTVLMCELAGKGDINGIEKVCNQIMVTYLHSNVRLWFCRLE